MTITPIGYLFFGSTIFGILLMVGVNRRWTKNGKPVGIVGSVFFGSILVTLSTLFFMFCFIGGKVFTEW